MRTSTRRNLSHTVLLPLAALVITYCWPSAATACYISQAGSLTPIQAEIEKQRQRLSAGDPEERRDALMKLGTIHRAEASRAALVGLTDSSPMVRVIAAKAILSIGGDECVSALTPLLSDKDEFVRGEIVYVL